MVDYNYYSQYFGTKYADLIKEYYEEEIEGNPSHEFVLRSEVYKNESVYEFMKDYLHNQLGIMLEHAYFKGLRDGVTNHQELTNDKPSMYNTSEYIMNKDITIMFDFHDNDFGGYLLEAAKEYATVYNNIVRQINVYTNIEGSGEYMLNSYKEDLENMENASTIAQFIRTAFVAKVMLRNVVDSVKFKPQTLGMEEYTTDSFIDKAKDYIDYLHLNDEANYRIGTYDDIEQYVVEEYKEMQDKDRGRTLTDCWLNGEVLFISMKNGEMKAWIQ